MYWVRKHVLVCTASHCAQKGANDVAGRLRLEVIRRGLDSEVLVNNCGTIDLCDIGPNVVEHLRGGPPVARLLLDRSSPEEEARRALYRSAVEPDPTRPDAEFAAL